MLAAVSLLVAVVAAATWSRRPAVVATAASAAAAVSLVDTAAFRGTGSVAAVLLEVAALMVVLARVVRRLPTRPAAGLGGLVAAAITLTPLRVAQGLEPPAPARETVLVCAFFAALAALAVALGGYLRSLDRARERSLAAARREQRVQLAGDLHDWFAHEVTGIVLEAQAGQLDAEPRTAEVLGRIEQAGQRALDSVDRALALLRDGPASPRTLDDVRDTVRRFGTVDLELPAALGPGTADTVHRVVLESLTNIRRHAGPVRRVAVRVAREEDLVTVTITDDGAGRRTRKRPGGSGLAALTERVTALGGTLTAGPPGPPGPPSPAGSDGSARPAGSAGPGWTVHVRLPERP